MGYLYFFVDFLLKIRYNSDRGDKMKIENILNAKQPIDIFQNIKNIKNEYRQLIKQFHPDTNKDSRSTECISIITKLYNNVIKNNILEGELLKIKGKNNQYSINYFYYSNFELGSYYVCKNNLVFLIKKEHEKYYKNYLQTVKSLKYVNTKMENEFKRYFPNIVKTDEAENEYILIISKTEDVVSLKNVAEYYGDKGVPIKHVAWIMNRLFNIASYFDFYNIVSNGICLDSIFISPQHHTVLILGGWWYTINDSEKLIGMPKSVYNAMPKSILIKKTANIKIDLESIKNVGKALLENQSYDEKLTRYFLENVEDKATKEFESFNNILFKIFGKRKFINWNIDQKIILRSGI